MDHRNMKNPKIAKVLTRIESVASKFDGRLIHREQMVGGDDLGSPRHLLGAL
jgi:hypothetical protein